MSEGKIFVGRKAELEQFTKALEDPQGQAILVAGQAGMGKTLLVNKMAELAENHPKLKCGWVRYEVTPTDSVDSTMALMMDNAFDAAQVTERSFNGTERRLEQWRSLLNVINIGDLVMSLQRDPAKNTRDQFLERLRLVSGRMPENGRAIFIIDPEKYMQKESDYAWGLVISRLPAKVKFLFPQRLEDVLVCGEGLARCDNIVRIPEGELERFDEATIEELVTIQSEQTPELQEELRSGAKRSDKSPYAVTGTMELITDAGMKAEDLAQYLSQEEVAQAQWRGICSKGEDAKKLFEAYAILEVGVPGGVVGVVSGLSATTRKRLERDSYLQGLLREEGEGKRIYHAILADFILGQIGEVEKKQYHLRAMWIYRERLHKDIKPDGLAAMRLPEHVLAAEGGKSFVDAFVNECTPPLLNLGLLDAAINFSERALGVVEKDSEEKTVVLGNLGVIYKTRGDLDKAEEMHKKSLEIDKKLGRLEGIASDYGNLGLIYQSKGQLDKAEEMHNKSLEIAEKLGLQEVMAGQYGNLGLIYQSKGQLDKAEEMHNKALEINEQIGRLEGMANQYAALGIVFDARGNLDEAEEMHLKGLEIEEKIGRKEGTARQYGNLGVIYMDRGQLDKAEEMHNKSLEINVQMGNKKGMAKDYGNLGLIYQKRGQLDKAEAMHKKSLEIAEKLGLQEIMANAYGNLGLIYQKRGELDKAEEMHNKALEINKKLGRLEGMASDYAALGLVYEKRGKLKEAEEMHLKGLEIEEKIGRQAGIARQHGNLGGIYQTRGQFDKAEEMHKKALETAEKLGHLEYMACEYGNLGLIYMEKGEPDKAEEMYKKSLEIDEKLGLLGGIASDYCNLGAVYKKKGDIAKAREYWEKALELYKKIGMKPEIEKVEGWIGKLKE